MTDRDTKPENVFSEDEYRADPGRVIAHAVDAGRAVVVRADGSPRVVISIPAAESKAEPEDDDSNTESLADAAAYPGWPE